MMANREAAARAGTNYLDDGPALPKRIVNGWRDPMIYSMHLDGLPLREIASRIGGISHEGVRAAIRRASKELEERGKGNGS